MINDKNILAAMCIPLFLSLCLACTALDGSSAGFGSGCLYLALLPLGLVCPLLAGCLLHDRIEDSFPRAAKALRRTGQMFVAALAAALCWMRLL